MERGQASVELLSILAIALLVILVFSVLAIDTVISTGRQQAAADARDAARSLATAAESVYFQGGGASKTVVIRLPASTVFDPNLTYVGRPANSTAEPTTININIGDTDETAISPVPLSGSFPGSPGTFRMRVVSRGNYVSIRPYVVDLDKDSVFIAMGRGQMRSENLTVYSATTDPVNVTLIANWGFSDVSFGLSPTSLSPTPAGASAGLAFTSSAGAGGIYNSEIIVQATDTLTGVNEAISVPVSVHVQN